MTEKIDVWIRRLRDSKVANRQEAIRQLEALGDPAALGPLATVFALDVDMETRMMAQWAGKSIYAIVERRATLANGATEHERNHAADILARAQAKKNNSRR